MESRNIRSQAAGGTQDDIQKGSAWGTVSDRPADGAHSDPLTIPERRVATLSALAAGMGLDE